MSSQTLVEVIRIGNVIGPGLEGYNTFIYFYAVEDLARRIRTCICICLLASSNFQSACLCDAVIRDMFVGT